jgi:phosphoribosylpyrophosphate synthetase
VGKSGIKYLKRKLEGNAVSIAFPDAGAHKRFKAMFEERGADGMPMYPSIICSKERDGDKRRVVIAEGEAAGKDVVIVDDLVHSGGTILECFKALKAAGARTVSAYVTHGVMENGAWERFRDAGFHRVYITDSCPETAKAVDGVEPFRVLTLAASIANAVMEGYGD